MGIKKILLGLTGGLLFPNVLWVLHARYNKDRFFLEHWKHSQTVVMRRSNSLAFWEASLDSDERECLRAWLSAMGLDNPLSTLFSPSLIVQDTLLFMCNFTEWQTAVRLLEKVPGLQVRPFCMEIRRKEQGSVVFVHAKLETELRHPLLTFVLGRKSDDPLLIFPSTVTLQLEKSDVKGKTDCGLCITAAEHRWFGGPLASQQSSSCSSPWGDMGDALRRFTAFWTLSLAHRLVNPDGSQQHSTPSVTEKENLAINK
ncbi:hypothetical protein ERJ75_001351800 [Trypanosoma vivax]|uniref:Uncharacterized protein n=1 Tax=Trypanosoma vivax (strain Y486) TaxID=1055687 RepID=G0UCY6_TRYVY|nr:hypothetical protein TRVL_06713 [Trypanosoma vivax]KAH8608218.1 hypothetical protein ERJ75_001351800 [Trypanosoma vivax]CCC53696.1 conserved hypothetical protein [Trypanosoma vivax Y486]